MGRGFSDVNPSSGNSNDRLKPEELWDIFSFQKDATTWTTFRILDTDLLPVKTHWIKIRAGKDKRETKIPKICVKFDPDNEKVPLEGVHCPYCELSSGQDGSCQTSLQYFANAIVRDLQDNQPRKIVKPNKEENKTGFKDVKSKSWTPVRVLRLPSSLVKKIQELKERNVYKGKHYDVNDSKYGTDVDIKFDESQSGTDKYKIERTDGGQGPLDSEERDYLVYDLDLEAIDLMGREKPEQAAEEFKKLDIIGHTDIEDDDDDDDLRNRSRKRKRDEDDDDEDESPRRSRRRSSDDEDDEDEDRSSRRRSRRRSSDDDDESPRRSRKRRSSLDDDDEDEAPSRRRSRRRSSDDEDDDEDESPRRSRRRSSERNSSKTRSKKRSR